MLKLQVLTVIKDGVMNQKIAGCVRRSIQCMVCPAGLNSPCQTQFFFEAQHPDHVTFPESM